MLALPAMAKAPAEGATLTLDDTLLALDQSEETFVATLKVPVSQEQKNWADNQWKDWADSMQWSLTRDKVDVQSPEYYPNIYTGDDLENWMSWGHINQHGADGEPYFSLEEPEFSVRDGFVTVVQQFSHGIFFNMKDETLPLVTNSCRPSAATPSATPATSGPALSVTMSWPPAWTGRSWLVLRWRLTSMRATSAMTSCIMS